MQEGVVFERYHVPDLEQDDYFRLTRKKIYILPTREGILLGIVVLTMLTGAINYNNNMAYMLTFLLVSVYVTTILHTYRNLAGLAIRGASPKPVFAGETAVFPLVIDNHGGHSRRAISFVYHPSNKTRKGITNTHEAVEADIPSDQWRLVDVKKTSHRRGILPLGRIMISSIYPLGLFRAWSYLVINNHCTVYPKPIGNRRLPVSLNALDQGHTGSDMGVDDFAGFRHYHPGDSIRNIAWKALAREQPLLVKRFCGSGIWEWIFTWDHVLHLPDDEARLSQLCLWILQAELEGYAYGLDIPGLNLKPAGGLQHRGLCLEGLARFGNHDADK